MKPEAWGQVFWTVPSFTSNRKASLQTWNSKVVEDSQCLSHGTAEAVHHQKKAVGQTGDGIEGRWQQAIQDKGYLGQRHLRQQVGVRSATRLVLSGSMKKLPWGKKYLGTFVSSSVPQETNQLLPQGVSGEANSNSSAHQLCSANG